MSAFVPIFRYFIYGADSELSGWTTPGERRTRSARRATVPNNDLARRHRASARCPGIARPRDGDGSRDVSALPACIRNRRRGARRRRIRARATRCDSGRIRCRGRPDSTSRSRERASVGAQKSRRWTGGHSRERPQRRHDCGSRTLDSISICASRTGRGEWQCAFRWRRGDRARSPVR
jgi:hypothetical protein